MGEPDPIFRVKSCGTEDARKKGFLLAEIKFVGDAGDCWRILLILAIVESSKNKGRSKLGGALAPSEVSLSVTESNCEEVIEEEELELELEEELEEEDEEELENELKEVGEFVEGEESEFKSGDEFIEKEEEGGKKEEEEDAIANSLELGVL